MGRNLMATKGFQFPVDSPIFRQISAPLEGASKAVNIEFLPVLIVEEVRTLFDADSKLSEMLPEMERASLSPQVRKAINRRRDLEQSQSKSLAEILARFDAHPSGGQCHAMRGLIGEAEEVLRRESGMYPARLEPRLLGVLRKVGHLRMAALKNLIAVAQLLEAHEIKKTLEDCLSQEVEADRFVADLTDDMLRLMTASSHGETANALDALQRYS
jgi:ferritin-like metal-binding protein YciE